VSLKHIPLIVCALAALTATAGAQFTAAVVPPRVKAAVDTTVKKDSVKRATVALAARVTDMRKWVDSAAGVSLPGGDSTALASRTDSTSTADSTGAGRSPAQVRDSIAQRKDSVRISRNSGVRTDSATSIATVEVHDSTGLNGADSAVNAQAPVNARSRAETRRFRAGATAPATATMLPFLAIAGVTTLLAGLALRRS
jgi:hypothetical protein